ncbi:hypothetical protein L596_021900 [Steinernema carpocapsae]|uniref:J domain-containing protein n=1 Tax=Steinernema carpocapsae TaxID=34508 RepID=A0A4V6A022_STECR|nr:hypothetical protein L596_021900 [Steinernema carpocapsae]
MSLGALRRIHTKVRFKVPTSVINSFCSPEKSDHELLELSPGAREDDIKKAYQKALKKYHPWQYGASNDSEIRANWIERHLAYQSLMREEKTFRKRLKHCLENLYNYVGAALFMIGFYEAVRYVAKEGYRRLSYTSRYVGEERMKKMKAVPN